MLECLLYFFPSFCFEKYFTHTKASAGKMKRIRLVEFIRKSGDASFFRPRKRPFSQLSCEQRKPEHIFKRPFFRRQRGTQTALAEWPRQYHNIYQINTASFVSHPMASLSPLVPPVSPRKRPFSQLSCEQRKPLTDFAFNCE